MKILYWEINYKINTDYLFIGIKTHLNLIKHLISLESFHRHKTTHTHHLESTQPLILSTIKTIIFLILFSFLISDYATDFSANLFWNI